MSGNFVQRGEPAIFDKWIRTEMALNGGADIVVELPELFSLSSAEGFAAGGIQILNSLNCIDYISFGCETNNFSLLNSVADMLAFEPDNFKTALKEELSLGVSYAKARSNAVLKIIPECKDILSLPNCILAIEYLKALKRTGSSIQPFFVERIGKYTDSNMNTQYPSAYAIRKSLKSGELTSNFKCIFPEDIFPLLLYKLRTMSLKEISSLAEVSEGLEYRIKSSASAAVDYPSLIENIKSKRYPEARIKRILIYSLLNITKDIMQAKSISHIRVLGVKQKSIPILKEICKCSKIPIVSNPKDFKDDISEHISSISSDIYGILSVPAKKANRNYTEKLIIL